MILAEHLRRTLLEPLKERQCQEGVKMGREEGVKMGREEGIETGREMGREEGVKMGIEKERAEWRAWNERREKAESRGEPFDEPPPGARG